MDRNSSKTLLVQMEELLRSNLDAGVWPPGSGIPSENELSSEYGISRMTVRSVITKLVQEGLLFRIPGKGTFVCEQKFEAKSLSYEGIRAQLEKMGYQVSTQLLSVQKSSGMKEVSQKLKIEDSEEIYIVKRLRTVKEKPLSLHTSYIPVKLAPGLETLNLVDDQLCSILSKNFDLNRARIFEELESIAATAEEAKLLNVPVGQPLLLLYDKIVDHNDIPFEYAKVVFRGDKIKLKLEF